MKNNYLEKTTYLILFFTLYFNLFYNFSIVSIQCHINLVFDVTSGMKIANITNDQNKKLVFVDVTIN